MFQPSSFRITKAKYIVVEASHLHS